MIVNYNSLKAHINKNYIDVFVCKNEISFSKIPKERIEKNNCPILRNLYLKALSQNIATAEFLKQRNFDKEIYLLINYQKKYIKNNYNKTIKNFSEKYDLNFLDNKNITFQTFTLHTDKNWDEKTKAFIMTKEEWCRQKWGFETEGDFKYKRTKLEDATNKKWLKNEFAKFIIKLRNNKILNNEKYVVVFEPQKRGVWHIHLVCEKFTVHDGKCFSGFHGKKYASCFRCNFSLAKIWTLGMVFVQHNALRGKKNPRVNLRNYLKKYMYKDFNIYDKNDKKYIFSNNCENVRIITKKIFTNIDVKNVNEIIVEKEQHEKELGQTYSLYDFLIELENDNKVHREIKDFEIENPITWEIKIKTIKHFKIYSSNVNYEKYKNEIMKLSNYQENKQNEMIDLFNFSKSWEIDFWKLWFEKEKYVNEIDKRENTKKFFYNKERNCVSAFINGWEDFSNNYKYIKKENYNNFVLNNMIQKKYLIF